MEHKEKLRILNLLYTIIVENIEHGKIQKAKGGDKWENFYNGHDYALRSILETVRSIMNDYTRTEFIEDIEKYLYTLLINYRNQLFTLRTKNPESATYFTGAHSGIVQTYARFRVRMRPKQASIKF